ncbi:hypothetical protein [Actinocrispum wychmicini]|uniref:Uncharacterized protein n=1 Tax=Actinocrispum wychmicini TaxID=1213861 RepID=A0A4R2JCH6_9PSEU|nr:hypothetical protein [Actinocrispum wychmicini]TCO57271.1 hypothetical protein EV192_106748 [Actinocrispum wychmicini]
MVDWKTDEEILGAANTLKDTFVAMLNDEVPASGYPRAEVDGLWRDKDIYMTVDPQKVYDEYNRVFKIALNVGDNYDAVGELRQSVRYLNNWTGDASVAFKKQIDAVEEFCRNVRERMLHGLLGLAATYAVAVQGRATFHALLMATDAAGHNEMDDQKKEDTKLKSALLFDMVGGIMGGSPEKLLHSTLESVVEMGKDFVDRAIEGNSAHEVMDSYRRAADALNDQFRHSIDHITKAFYDQTVDADGPADMVKPLPPKCDIRSPDFRYENFENTVHNPGPIGPSVEDERKKYVAEKSQQSEIDKRMNPGGKREI